MLQNLVVADVEEIEVEYTGHGRILRQLAFPFFKELKRLMLGNLAINSRKQLHMFYRVLGIYPCAESVIGQSQYFLE